MPEVKALPLEMITSIAVHFDIQGSIQCIEPIGNGFINDTFRITANNNEALVYYTIQRINKNVFHHPDEVMMNISSVIDFLKEKISSNNGDPSRETLQIIKSDRALPYVIDDQGDYWRCYRYITDASAYDVTDDVHVFREVAYAFGLFFRYLSDFPANTLYFTIPDFHNTPRRYENFEHSRDLDVVGRRASVASEIAFAEKHRYLAYLLQRPDGTTDLPLRVTHNDTKLSNVLIDNQTGRGLCVIDLDTIMPGLVAHDFGDAIRSGANTAFETETDLSKVRMSLDKFEHFTEGFLSGAGPMLTKAEIQSLVPGVLVLTYEGGLRALTDYLDGDTYYNISYPQQNLDRARNQFALLSDMMTKIEEMNRIVDKYVK